jgi:coenzyme F420 hydrogenase subunit beta
VINCYTAYAKDDEIRHRGTSGGVITAMLLELVAKGDYDCAFVAPKLSPQNIPLQLQAASTEEEIRNAAGSKYVLPVASNVFEALHEKKGKYVVVGCPCVLHEIQNFMRVNDLPRDNVLFLGLFCVGTMNYNILRYYADRYCKFESIAFRQKVHGWPGDTVLDEVMIVDRKERVRLKQIFTLPQCYTCKNKLNSHADISFGDCYIPVKRNQAGVSSVIVRTEKGAKAWEQCASVIESEPESLRAIEKAQQIGVPKPDSAFQRWLTKQGTHYNYHKVRFALRIASFVTALKTGSKIARIGWGVIGIR